MIHIHRARAQTATNYTVDLGETTLKAGHPPSRPIRALCCKLRRQARNLVVHVYYDGEYYFCVDGKGCKTKKARPR